MAAALSRAPVRFLYGRVRGSLDNHLVRQVMEHHGDACSEVGRLGLPTAVVHIAFVLRRDQRRIRRPILGLEWQSLAGTGNAGPSHVEDVSCSSNDFCAVALSNGTARTWNGTGWSNPRPLIAATHPEAEFQVSCASRTMWNSSTNAAPTSTRATTTDWGISCSWRLSGHGSVVPHSGCVRGELGCLRKSRAPSPRASSGISVVPSVPLKLGRSRLTGMRTRARPG
jgi:hypothetical protein